MDKNPIKHVKFSRKDYFKPTPPRGGKITYHKDVTPEFIEELVHSIDKITDDLQVKIKNSKIACTAVVVELENTAISKSNRPNKVFNDKTCPFFGDVGFSKFLIKATPSGLKSLKDRIKTSKGDGLLSAISTIKSISTYKPFINIDDKYDCYTIRLLKFDDNNTNMRIEHEFEEYLNSCSFKWERFDSEVISLYRVCLHAQNISELCNQSVFVQSITSNKAVTEIRTQSHDNRSSSGVFMSHPESGDYPVVGIVDTGVSHFCEPLEPWIAGRLDLVPSIYKEYHHGTFVAGLISNANLLNNNTNDFPKSQAKVFSIEAIGSDGGDLYEIIQALYTVAKNNPNIRVWNLSLGDESPVDISCISEFALLLDEFQDRQNCLCVVSSGNYLDGETRTWPPVKELDDRVCSPGDSIRALTVGSVAHKDGFVSVGEPSSFSRKGPVSNFVQKPEIVHFGGNLNIDGSQSPEVAICSVDPDGVAAHSVGTSFSAPLVATIAANLFHQLGERATPTLVKGLLIHSANLKGCTPKEYKEYYGWGIPADVDDILSVSDYETTLVMEGIAKKSFEIEKLPFPIPECLRTEEGKVRAEFFITLAYCPELDPKKSFEYCQIDLNVGLGKIENGKFSSKVPLQSSTPRYEKDMTKSGDKWSPIKVYHKVFPKGTDIENWKLRLAVLNRDGYEAEGVEIPFSLILTIRDIDRQQPVYNEMTRLMDQFNWEVSDLVIDTRIKL